MKFITYKNYIALVVLFAFIVLGIAARSVEVINRNFLFGFDHGREYLMTRDIVVNHHPTLIGTALGAGSAGINGVFHGPGYYYFLAIPFIIFSGDPYGGVVLMFVFGLASLIVMLILAGKMFGKWKALVPVALLSLSPEIVSQSRSIWSPHPSTFFVLLSFLFIYLFIKSIGKKRLLYILLAAFFAGFIYNFEFAIAVPLTFSIFIFVPFVIKKDIKGYLVMLLGTILAYFPMLLFEVRHNFMAIHGVINYLTASHSTSHKFSYVVNLYDHLMSFSYNLVSSFPHQDLIQPFVLFLLFALSLYYLLKIEKKSGLRKFMMYLLMLPFLTFIILSFLKNTVYPNYLYHLNIVYILIFSYCFWGFYKLKGRMLGKYIFSFLLAFFLIISVPYNIKMISYDLHDYGGTDKIRGKEEALDYIFKDAAGQHFNLLVFTPPVYTYPYDYLISWYANKKYGYIPGKEKKGLFYLLIQPDPAKPWSYKEWLETVIKSGKEVKQVQLPSGFIVQKRYE